MSFAAKILLAFAVVAVAGCASKTPAPVDDRSTMPAPEQKAAPVERVAAKGYYIVKEGDTLYRIALDHGQDYREVAAWNQLTDANVIKAGQELRVAPPENDVTAGATAVAVAKPIAAPAPIEKRPLDATPASLKKEPKAGREIYSDDAYAKAMKAAGVVVAVAPQPETKTPVTPAASTGPDDVKWAWPASGKVVAPYVENGNKGLDIAGKAGDPVFAAGDGKVVYSGSGLRGYGQLVIVKHNATYLTAYAHNSKVLVKEGQAVTRGQKIAEMGNSEADQVKLHFEVRRQGRPVDPLKYLPPR